MRQLLLMTAFACTSLLGAATQQAEAQVFWRPWLRPRVVFMPPRIITSAGGPTVFAAPQIIIQPPYQAPAPYYYPPPAYAPPPPAYAPPPPPVYYQQPAPPPVYYQPPQVYVQPAPPPVYYQQPQQQVYAPPPPQQPVYAPPPPPTYYRPAIAPQSQWAAKFGLGGRFAGIINTDQGTTFSQLGFGGEVLYRIHRRVVMELAGEYQKRVDNGFARYDVPVTLGVRLHIGAPDWVVSPYLVAAAGGAYANLDYLRSQDAAWFLDGQLGGGLEIRLGRHFAITGDVRLDARHRMTKADDATVATTSINGKPFAPMGDSYGAQFRLGAALYF